MGWVYGRPGILWVKVACINLHAENGYATDDKERVTPKFQPTVVTSSACWVAIRILSTAS